MLKTWQKPQLLILTRSKHEEAVLVNCKSLTTIGVDNSNASCKLGDYPCLEQCSDIVST